MQYTHVSKRHINKNLGTDGSNNPSRKKLQKNPPKKLTLQSYCEAIIATISNNFRLSIQENISLKRHKSSLSKLICSNYFLYYFLKA